MVLCSTYARDDLPEHVRTSGAAAYLNKEDLRPGLLRQLWDGTADGARLTPP